MPWSIRYATRALSWDDGPSSLRIIFVAENESADQDRRYTAARQKTQDANAMRVGPTAASERAVAKSSGLHTNSGWDLVDAVAEKRAALEELSASALPEKMRAMTEAERAAYIAGLAARRSSIQEDIRALSAKRDAYVKAEMSKRSLTDAGSFDAAVRGAVRAQAEAKGFAF